MPFLEDTAAEDFANDNLEYIIFGFAFWMSSTNIPAHLKMESLPALESSTKNPKFATVTSKEKCLLHVMNETKRVHGRDPVMAETMTLHGEPPSWFGPLKARFSADATRFQLLQLICLFLVWP